MKLERITIKCGSTELKKRFRRFAADYKDYETAFKALLDLAEEKGYVLRK